MRWFYLPGGNYMMHRFLISSFFLLWASSAVAADFSYENIKRNKKGHIPFS
jgi:hypothetical protein